MSKNACLILYVSHSSIYFVNALIFNSKANLERRGFRPKFSMKISPNGQITIPPDIQEKLGLLPGTEIQLEVIGDILQIRKPRTLSRGKQLIAAIRGKATSRLTTNDIMQATRDTKSGY